MNRLKDFTDDSLFIIDTAGGKIGLDVTDIEIDLKVKAMYDKFTHAQKHFKQQHAILDKKEDGKVDELGISNKTTLLLNLQRETIGEIEQGIDGLFGKGASDKIFYHEILGEPLITLERVIYFLEEALPEQLEKVGVKAQEYLESRTTKEERAKFLDKEETDILEVE